MQEENPTRRSVLRGALAAGCSLWLPVVLSGCDSKKDELPKTTTAPVSPPPPAPAPTAATAPATAAPLKVPKTNVQYQAEPKGEQKCSTCLHFIAESNTCKLVEGDISPNGWCSVWVGKA